MNLEALAISDHDTFAGYDRAAPIAREANLDLICGIELSTRFGARTVHLLGYFLDGPSAEFRAWLDLLQAARRDRNLRLVLRLESLGVNISIDEVESKGHRMAGRPHFARLLVEKGYVENIQQAFDEYLNESAKGYVERQDPPFSEGAARIVAGGGIPSLAHPIRIRRDPGKTLKQLFLEMRDQGLRAIEAYHSDHHAAETEEYLALAAECGFAVTGGSDFHGSSKPRVRLGTGKEGNLNVPRTVLDQLRSM